MWLRINIDTFSPFCKGLHYNIGTFQRGWEESKLKIEQNPFLANFGEIFFLCLDILLFFVIPLLPIAIVGIKSIDGFFD